MNANFSLVRGADLQSVGRDWYAVGHHFQSLLGPEHDIRIVATGKLYRIGDLTYQRLVNGSKPTPYGWLELTEDGEPVEEADDTLNDIAAENEAARDDEFNTWGEGDE